MIKNFDGIIIAYMSVLKFITKLFFFDCGQNSNNYNSKRENTHLCHNKKTSTSG